MLAPSCTARMRPRTDECLVAYHTETQLKTGRKGNTMIRVAVITPSDNEPQRHVYWGHLIKELEHWDVVADIVPVVSFWSEGNATYQNWSKYQVLVISTDAANGAKEFEGRNALDYFQNERAQENILKWVREGGILFCEAQSQGGKPHQPTYDAIFGLGSTQTLPARAQLRREAPSGEG